MGVNVSPRQLRRAGAAAEIAATAARHGVDPSRFVLEITESAWTMEAARVLPVLHALRDAGFALAIDDFGAGYSSLRRLLALPVQVVKVDRAFLQGVPREPRPTRVLDAILSLAAACDCDVVAEGVEEPAQESHLVDAGCLLAQGFHFARPLPGAEVEPLLRAGMAPGRRSA
jgi:EAL domain-containing protein (putative c-di-GMP-specific phosphodiesterase class I)